MAEIHQNQSAITSVILAEDDRGFARLLMKNLARCGLATPVQWLSDGKELMAFLEARRQRIAADTERMVILLDLAMPQLDGLRVLRCLQEDRDLFKIPVVVLTTSSEEEEMACCYQMGCRLFLTKPPDYAKLTTFVSGLLEHQRISRTE